MEAKNDDQGRSDGGKGGVGEVLLSQSVDVIWTQAQDIKGLFCGPAELPVTVLMNLHQEQCFQRVSILAVK